MPEQAPTEIDLTLLDWFLSLSPMERLEMNDNAANELDELRRAATASLQKANVTKCTGALEEPAVSDRLITPGS